jgi:hypothetical protein
VFPDSSPSTNCRRSDSENVTSKPSNTTVKPKKPAAKISNILLKKSYAKEFKYPLYIDLRQLVDGLESGNTTISVEPIVCVSFSFLDDTYCTKFLILTK